jgi:uncharacterized membrane protein YozB (DUF420 family)
MLRSFVRNNITLTAITIFVVIFAVVQVLKPGFLYKQDGSIREFGVGTKNKTIMPVWLFSIILGILSYLVVTYYVAFPKLY